MQSAIEKILAGSTISKASIESLEQSFNEHPYSSTLAIILAKAYVLNNDIRLESHIRKTAILSNNRKQLHEFLFNESTQNNTPDEILEESPSVETKIEEKNETREERISSAEQKELKNNSIDSDQDEDPLLKQFITEAINAGAAIDLLSEGPEVDEKETTDDNPDSVEVEKQEELKQAEGADEEINIEPPSKQSFSHWMNFLSDQEVKSTVKQSITEPLQTVFPRDQEEKKKVISIIDNFIEKEDSLVPKRAEFFSPSKAAKASLEDNDSVVTETLASIYAAQGNINKAISTYNKLSLLHPEKSSYFAALIEKLKSEKKDNKS